MTLTTICKDLVLIRLQITKNVNFEIQSPVKSGKSCLYKVYYNNNIKTYLWNKTSLRHLGIHAYSTLDNY